MGAASLGEEAVAGRSSRVPWSTHPWTAIAVSVLAVSGGYYVAGILSLASRVPSSGISTLWLASSVVLAAFLVVPVRTWWLYCVALLPFHFHLVVKFQGPVPLPVMLVQIAGNCAHALLCAIVLRRLLGAPARITGMRNLSLFILVCVGSSALVSALVVRAFNELEWSRNFWVVWRARTLSNGIAGLIVVPLVLWVMNESVRTIRQAPARRFLEFAVLVGALVAVGSVVFGDSSPSGKGFPALIYAPLPVLLWAAVRFDMAGLSAALMAIGLESLAYASAGRGPFTGQSAVENVLGLQLFLFAIATPLMLLAALIRERRETLEAIRRTDAALRDGYAHIRELAQRLISAQEAERRRFARDLHDDLSQELELLALDIRQLHRHAPESSSLVNDVQSIGARVRSVAASVHSISHQLHPSRLEAIGLVASIQGLCNDVSGQHDLVVDFEHHGVPQSLGTEASLALYRIVQEALHNVMKHSGAREARVSLIGSADHVDLRIADGGAGFAAASPSRSGIGLVSMRERADAVGGTITIESSVGGGTRIAVSIPLPSSDQSTDVDLTAPAVIR